METLHIPNHHFAIFGTSWEPKGTPPRNSQPYDQGQLTILFPLIRPYYGLISLGGGLRGVPLDIMTLILWIPTTATPQVSKTRHSFWSHAWRGEGWCDSAFGGLEMADMARNCVKQPAGLFGRDPPRNIYIYIYIWMIYGPMESSDSHWVVVLKLD